MIPPRSLEPIVRANTHAITRHQTPPRSPPQVRGTCRRPKWRDERHAGYVAQLAISNPKLAKPDQPQHQPNISNYAPTKLRRSPALGTTSQLPQQLGRQIVRTTTDLRKNAGSCALTMRLSDAGMRQRKTKLIYPNHRPSPWSTKAATRDRSNRLLEVRVLPTTKTDFLSALGAVLKQKSALNAWQHRSKTNGDQSVPRTKHIDTTESAHRRSEGSEARDVSGLLLIRTTASVRCDHLKNRRSVNLGNIDSNDRDGKPER